MIKNTLPSSLSTRSKNLGCMDFANRLTREVRTGEYHRTEMAGKAAGIGSLALPYAALQFARALDIGKGQLADAAINARHSADR